jgi:hypothetical protein
LHSLVANSAKWKKSTNFAKSRYFFYIKKADMKRISLITLLLAVSVLGFAQDKIGVVFNEVVHNFGTVKEEEGKVTTLFTFVNTSSMPITILRVKASCGCTTPQYSVQPIAPDGTGQVIVSYNPDRRPGTFNKSITVQVSNGNETRTEIIKITGIVLPKIDSTKNAADENFHYRMGNLALRERSLDIGSIIKGQKQEKTFEIYNTSDKDIKLTFGSVPDFITLSFNGQPILKAKATTSITVSYDSEKDKNWAVTSNMIQLKADGKNVGEYLINADIKEDFSKISQRNVLQAPKIRLSPNSINLMSIKNGTKRTTKVTVSNEGESPLIIHSINLAPGINVFNFKKSVINSGQSLVFEISIDTAKLQENQFKTNIQIVSNDPITPVAVVNLEWRMEY